MDILPKFESPPLVETVLSVQFNRLSSFSNALAGWFWKDFLGHEWKSSQPNPRLKDVFEKFGVEGHWTAPPVFELVPGMEAERLQILRDDEERMIQIQDSRFIYNWRKREGVYPSYEKLLPEFRIEFDKFLNFVARLEDSKLTPNQWEVTYVNQIPKGELWQTPDDWVSIFPWLNIPPAVGASQKFESFSGNWKYEIKPEIGRLHITLRHARITGTSDEVIMLNLTARGAVDEKKLSNFVDGFNAGHAAIVQTFADITSAEAHNFWKRSR